MGVAINFLSSAFDNEVRTRDLWNLTSAVIDDALFMDIHKEADIPRRQAHIYIGNCKISSNGRWYPEGYRIVSWGWASPETDDLVDVDFS